MDKLGLSLNEAAACVGISSEKLYLEIRAGNGPEVVRIGRRILIPPEKLASWFHGLSTKPKAL